MAYEAARKAQAIPTDAPQAIFEYFFKDYSLNFFFHVMLVEPVQVSEVFGIFMLGTGTPSHYRSV